jgi:hypothetical protein
MGFQLIPLDIKFDLNICPLGNFIHSLEVLHNLVSISLDIYNLAWSFSLFNVFSLPRSNLQLSFAICLTFVALSGFG